MDLTFNVLESIRRDIRELRDDLHIEKQSRRKDVEELQTEVKTLKRDVRLLRQDLVAEREARETGMEALRREMSEELRREVGQVHADIDAQRKRIRVQEEEGFITIDGTCISWGSDDLKPGGAPAATDIDFPRKYRTPPMVFSAPRDHCSFVIGTGDNGSTRVRKDGFTASGLSFAGAESTRKGCMMSWMAIGSRVMDADRAQEAGGAYDARMPRLDQMSADEQEKMFRNLFRQADVNGNGTLDQREFRQLLQAVNLNLSRSAIRRIMEQADVNNDGSIEYREFVPVIMDVIATHTELGDAAQASQEEQMKAFQEATQYVLEGMTRSQLESAALRIFQAADDDQSGLLDRKEFTACLRAMNLGFTTKEIQALMGEVDVNRDGFVSYDEFLPVAVDLMIQTYADKLLESSSTAKIEEHFMAMFSAADTDGSGKLGAPDLRAMLSNAGMSAVQVEVCMGDAQIGGDNCVVYSKFARICAQYGGAYFGGKPPPPKDMSKLSNEELSTFLEALFASADKDNSGALDEREFRALLQESGLNLTRKAILRIMEAADANDDGLIQYPEFCQMMTSMNLTTSMTAEARERMQETEEQCQLAAEELMGQQSEESIQKHMRSMFMSADVDGSGYLSRNEFIQAMQDADLGLTKKEIVAMMSELDVNDDGKIEYGEFVPLARSIVLDFIKMKLMEGSAKQSVLMEFFMQKFGEVDPRDTGKLSCDTVRSVLTECGMSNYLVESLIATANVDGGGNITYKRFARVCAEVANSDVNKAQPKSALSNEGRRARAIALFRRVDLDNSGRIDPSEMESYIKRLSAKFRHDMDEAEQLAHIEEFKHAPVSEPEFVEYILHTYAHVSDEQFYGFLDYCDSETYFTRVRRLRTLFWKLDADGSGVVDAEEKRAYCKKLAHKMGRPLTDEEINEAICDFAFIDKNCDGQVTEEEFITSLLELFEEVDDDMFMKAMSMFDVRSDADRSVIIANLFRRHDLDHDGFWDAREVRIYFQKFGEKNGHHMTEEDLTFSMRQFNAVDRNGDGKVSQEEFVNFFMAETSDITDEEFYDAIEFFDT